MKKNSRAWIGFDLGGTKMMAGVFNADFKLLGTERKKTKADEGQKSGLNRMIDTIVEAIENAGLTPASLAGIGVGSPGPLDLNRGILIDTPNLGWKNVPLRKILSARFKCPVYVGNDVDVGTYGEYRFGAARNARCVLGVFPGTGIGGACVYEGRLVRGRSQSCMEIGHIRVQADGRLCGCGKRGCLETVASRLAISADCAMAVYRGESTILARLAGTNLADIRSGTLAEAIRKGDAVVEKILRQAAVALGRSIGGVVNLLAPDVVVLGGGLVEALPDLFRQEVEEACDAQAMAAFRGTYKVRIAKLGDNAGIMGAAALAADLAESAKGVRK